MDAVDSLCFQVCCVFLPDALQLGTVSLNNCVSPMLLSSEIAITAAKRKPEKLECGNFLGGEGDACSFLFHQVGLDSLTNPLNLPFHCVTVRFEFVFRRARFLRPHPWLASGAMSLSPACWSSLPLCSMMKCKIKLT